MYSPFHAMASLSSPGSIQSSPDIRRTWWRIEGVVEARVHAVQNRARTEGHLEDCGGGTKPPNRAQKSLVECEMTDARSFPIAILVLLQAKWHCGSARSAM
jgi:hypothetical protein